MEWRKKYRSNIVPILPFRQRRLMWHPDVVRLLTKMQWQDSWLRNGRKKRTVLLSDQNWLDDPTNGSRDAAAGVVETMMSTKQTELVLRKPLQISGLDRQLLLKRCWPWLLFFRTLIPWFNRCCVMDQPLVPAIELVYMLVVSSIFCVILNRREWVIRSREVLQNNLGPGK